MPEKATPLQEYLTIYVVHEYLGDLPIAMFLNYADAYDLAGTIPRGMIHEVRIEKERWVRLEEFDARRSE